VQTLVQTDDQQRRTSPPLSTPQTGILRSSELLGWRGIVVELRYHPAGEYVFPSSSSHMIGLHLGPPIPIEQVRNGRPFANMMAHGSLQIGLNPSDRFRLTFDEEEPVSAVDQSSPGHTCCVSQILDD
jgi:hypothetical protein